MKFKTITYTSVILGITLFSAHSATLTWDNGGAGSGFLTAGNWSPDQVPTSSDSVVLDGIADLSGSFTVGNMQSMTDVAGTSLRMRIASGGVLTVGSGGTLNITGGIAESGGGGVFVVDAGASLVSMYQYWNDEAAYTNRFIASSTGVTPFTITNRFALRGTNSVLDVDLTNYDTANGDTITLFNYGSLLLQHQAAGDNGFGTYTVTAPGGGTWTQDVHFTIDLAGGTGNSITLTIIPEPSSAALLGLGGLALFTRRRK